MRRVWLAAALAIVALSSQHSLLSATAAAAPSPLYGEIPEQRDTRFASSSPWKGKARDTSGAHTGAWSNGHFAAAVANAGAIADAAGDQERDVKAMYTDRNGERSRQAIVEASLERLSRGKVPFVHPSPIASPVTLQRRSSDGIMDLHDVNVEKGTGMMARQAAHAYASGIIAE